MTPNAMNAPGSSGGWGCDIAQMLAQPGPQYHRQKRMLAGIARAAAVRPAVLDFPMLPL